MAAVARMPLRRSHSTLEGRRQTEQLLESLKTRADRAPQGVLTLLFGGADSVQLHCELHPAAIELIRGVLKQGLKRSDSFRAGLLASELKALRAVDRRRLRRRSFSSSGLAAPTVRADPFRGPLSLNEAYSGSLLGATESKEAASDADSSVGGSMRAGAGGGSLPCAACSHEGERGGTVARFYADSCGHVLCAACLKATVAEAVAACKTSSMCCPVPSCSADLPPHVLQQALTEAEFERYLEAGLSEFLHTDEFIVECPHEGCAAVCSVDVMNEADVPADVGETDDDGKPLSADAWLHFNLHRIRCRECNKDFCASCRYAPYHKGFTCEGWLAFQAAAHCRFCGCQLTDDNRADGADELAETLRDVCSDEECVEKRALSCARVKACGHACGGCAGESEDWCLPCLQPACLQARNDRLAAEAALGDVEAVVAGESKGEEDGAPPPRTLSVAGLLLPEDPRKLPISQAADDYCNICWVDELSAAPCVQLSCGHLFHASCMKQKLAGRWPGQRITFGFLRCPLCTAVAHSFDPAFPLKDELEPMLTLYFRLRQQALRRLTLEGMADDAALKEVGGKYFHNAELYALDSFAFYSCFKCKKPYFGGRRACEAAVEADSIPAEDMVCYDCSPLKLEACGRAEHKDSIIWKCRYCCDLAVWFCFGTHHFCNSCHDKWIASKLSRATTPDDVDQCAGAASCPLGREHPPNGGTEEFSLGCSQCLQDAEASRQLARTGGGGVEEGKGDGAGNDGDDVDLAARRARAYLAGEAEEEEEAADKPAAEEGEPGWHIVDGLVAVDGPPAPFGEDAMIVHYPRGGAEKQVCCAVQ
eukprot:PLAT4540.1.p1 GENE.PLAT4540.1~~PLAT4540.1.p1  ORF type:complete len:829 (+),score=264.74 PLAT4540.1:25-2487(+)